MDNQHRKIEGYQELSQEEINLINQIKLKGNEIGNLISNFRKKDEFDQRWISIGATDIQKGIMCLIRGIAKPDSF